MKKYKVLFIDLDGTLIQTKSGKTFPEGIWDMEFKFGVLNAIKNLSPEYVCIVSNQGGIELGHVEFMHVVSKMTYVCSVISEYCKIEDRDVQYSFCQFNNKQHRCRKPNTGMLEDYLELNFNRFSKPDCSKEEILMVGDASGLPGQFSDSDKKCAENFGIDYLDVDDFCKKYLEN
jgi:DNA 3'-phosphatase